MKPRRLRGRSLVAIAACCAVLGGAPPTALGSGAPSPAVAPADLTVVAFGAQRLDLASGRTVLDDGGEIVDRRSGVRLVAAWIAYAEGVEVVAREARVIGDVGAVTAAEVTIDLSAGRVFAVGGVSWSRDGFEVAGASLWFDASAAMAGLFGGVAAAVPDAAAAEVWVDLIDGRALLIGPYRFVDGPLSWTGGAGGVLQLDPVEVDGVVAFDARSEADPAWSERVAGARAAAGLPAR